MLSAHCVCVCVQDEDLDFTLAADFETGHFFRERIIPRAVLYFTGEALEDDDSVRLLLLTINRVKNDSGFKNTILYILMCLLCCGLKGYVVFHFIGIYIGTLF